MDKNTIEQIKRFRHLDTSCISDALDRLEIKGWLQDVHPIIPNKKICGPAYTVHFSPCSEQKLPTGGYIDDVEEGYVIVIDNAGHLDCGVWGDIMALAAKQKKLEGTLINGACRDLPALRESGYPVFAKGQSIVGGSNRAEVDALCISVSFSDIQIRPGDLIIADDTGAVVVPLSRAEEVLQKAEAINNREKEIINLLKRGKSLKKAVQLCELTHISKGV